MGTRDLFQNEHLSQSPIDDQIVSSSENEKVIVASHRLAVRFTEDTQLPARFRSSVDPSRRISKVKEDAKVEKRYKANVESWRKLIENMLCKIEEGQAWRFINLCPQAKGAIARATDNKDFCDFIDYLILRRDKEQCGSDELGGLALLSVAFQREVEKQIPK